MAGEHSNTIERVLCTDAKRRNFASNLENEMDRQYEEIYF